MTRKFDKPVVLIMDPDSSLNRAHQCERKAERMLNSGRYETALQCYKDAAGLITEAMANTNDEDAILSLSLQKQRYDKMPRLVEMRKQKSHSKNGWISLHLNERNLPENPFLTEDVENDKQNGDVTDGKDVTLGESENLLKSMEGALVDVRNETSLREDRLESFETLDSIASENADSLLQCLNEHYRENKGERRVFYYTSGLIRAIRAKYTRERAVSEQRENEAHMPHPQGRGSKMEKSEKVRCEELEVKNAELTKHILNLLAQLESCEQENARLKVGMRELQQKLESQKTVTATWHGSPNFRDEFSVLFSVTDPAASDVKDSLCISEPRIVIPQTPPALPPLEMPKFEE